MAASVTLGSGAESPAKAGDGVGDIAEQEAVFSMQLAVLDAQLVVVRFAGVQEYVQHCESLLDAEGGGGAFTSVTVTREEVSVVLD